MRYDFDTVTDRRNTGSMKWDVPENELPMWVADMDFRTAPEIIEALEERVRHGIFGYTDVTDDWKRAYTGWWKERHGFSFPEEWLVFSTGVVPTLSSCVRKLTTPNENIVILTPVYNIFFNSILNNGARAYECPLDRIPGNAGENDTYVINFEGLEKAFADPQTTLMIFCNPHNPTGTVWDRETLRKVGDLAKKYHVTVISDEIHCDLTDPGTEYIPFASVSENCNEVSITCVSPTKAFNLAGIQTSAVIVPDRDLRHKVWRGLNTDECGEPNVFAVTAAVAAFEKGGDWLDALRQYLYENKKLVKGFLSENLPKIKLCSGDATYLLWLDMSAYGGNSKQLQKDLRKKAGLFLSVGDIYGKAGEGFLRMNVACPRTMVEEGLKRLRDFLE